ncbi:MAG: LapA family protein [Nitrospirae bacterium]|nr:LapA family protein [Nitrospirota bacterium]
MIRLVLALIFLVLAFILAVENRTEVPIVFLFGYVTGPIPVYLVAFSSFLIGACMTLIFTLPPWVRNKVEIRRLKRTLHNTESHERRKEI